MSEAKSKKRDAPDEVVRPPTPKAPLVLGILNLLAIVAVGAVVLLSAGDGPAATTAEGEAEVPEEPPVVAELDPFVANLDEPSESARYVKAKLALQLSGASSAEQLEANKLAVRDVVLTYLSGLTVADTLGAESKEKIREQLLERVGGALGDDRVTAVYLAEFVVQ